MEQVIIGGYYDLLHTGTTEYNMISGGLSWTNDPDNVAQTVSTPGTLKNLRVELNDVPGTGTYVVTLHRRVGLGGWANTTLTCTVAADGTTASDTVNEVSVAAGDVICLQCNPDSPDSARYARWTMIFEGNNAKESLILGQGVSTTGSTQYFAMGRGISTGVEDEVRSVCPTNGTIKNLFVQLENDPGTAPDAYRYTLRINGVTKSVTTTITANNKIGNDTGNSEAVLAGDIITLMCEPLNTPSTSTATGWGVTFVADTDGESLILGGSDNSLNATTIEYNLLVTRTSNFWDAAEAEAYQLAQECTFKSLYMLLKFGPGNGDGFSFKVRRNGASPGGGLGVDIVGAAVTGNDTVNTIAISDDDEVDMMCDPTGLPGSLNNAYWGLVAYIEPPEAGGIQDKSANMASKLVAAGVI